MALPPGLLYELLRSAPSFYQHPLVLNSESEHFNSSELPSKSTNMTFAFRERSDTGSENKSQERSSPSAGSGGYHLWDRGVPGKPHWVLALVTFLEMYRIPGPASVPLLTPQIPVSSPCTMGAPLGTPLSSLSIHTSHRHIFLSSGNTPKILSHSADLLYALQNTLRCRHVI